MNMKKILSLLIILVVSTQIYLLAQAPTPKQEPKKEKAKKHEPKQEGHEEKKDRKENKAKMKEEKEE